jgi:BASS family bile acid:Na+ symporter
MSNFSPGKIIRKISKGATKYFTLWVLLACIIAFRHPPAFSFVLPNIALYLGIIMFGMGMTLRIEDFKRVLTRPRPVLCGVAAQYSIMPLLALSIARGLDLSPELAAGVILLGCCPGGTASNVICYLAGADVALSVSMTSLSTLLAPLFTPILTLFLAGQYLPVQAWELFQSIAVIVLTPVALGLLARHFLEGAVKKCLEILPVISVITIVLLVGAIVGKSSEQLLAMGTAVMLSVFLHNGLGLCLGYGVGALAGADLAQRRAMSIEVGMQNSGLALALASLHFSPLAALPAAFFSIWHNISGPLLAGIWSRSATNKPH